MNLANNSEKPMTKMIAFDLFGVIFTEGHMVSGTLMPLLPSETKKPLIKGFYNRYTRGEITEEAFWVGIAQPNNIPLRRNFLDTFVLDESLPDVAAALSKKYALSILSNLGKEWAEVLINKFQFNKTFYPIIISGEVGYEKPDLAIYKMLTKKSRIPAEQILFIDDRLENLAAAHTLGMKTAHYKREADDFNYQADYCIKKLSDILRFL